MMKYAPCCLLLFTCLTHASEQQRLEEKLAQLERQLAEVKTTLAELKSKQVIESESAVPAISLGGALRFQYVFEDYNENNRERAGDLDFDLFRLQLSGEIGDVELSAQYRWFQYMDVIHHAWAGYQLNKQWKIQGGITRVDFGILPYSSHNYFFSSGYYVGLEDDYDAGIKLLGDLGDHDLTLGFFFTDEMGGIDGFVSDRTERYSYDVVGIRSGNEGTYDKPEMMIAEYHSANMRYAYQFDDIELGMSLIYGDLRNETMSVGDRLNYALHLNGNFGKVNLQLQYSHYDYDLDNHAPLLVVGAYSFYDTIPAEATLYTANIAYSQPVKWGPVTSLNFYNDFNLMNDKSGGFKEDTIMNVLGVAVSAGGLYTYFDLVAAKNQPFIGGSMGLDSDDWQTRFNINFGYYF